MRRLKEYLPIFGVFCLALLVRVIYNVIVARGYDPTFDAGIYDKLARSLVETGCYCSPPHQPTVFRPPLWPFMIAGIYSLLGAHSAYVRLLDCFLGSGTCIFVYLLARDIFNKRIALIVGLLAAIYTGLFIWDGWLYTESLYTFCLTAFIYAAFRVQQNLRAPAIGKQFLRISPAGWRWIVAGGILLGLASLARPTGSEIIGLLCIWAILVILARMIHWQAAILSVVAIVLLAFVVQFPWMVRNYTVTHSFFPVSTLGQTLAGAYNDHVLEPDPSILHGTWWLDPSRNADIHPYTEANERSDMALALHWIRAHLNDMPSLLLTHLRNMWRPYTYSFGSPLDQFPDRLSTKVLLVIIPIMEIPVFLLAALGLLLTWKRKKAELLLVYLVIAMTIVQNIVFYGSPRFRAPIEPLLLLLAGGAFWWFIERRKKAQPLEPLVEPEKESVLSRV